MADAASDEQSQKNDDPKGIRVDSVSDWLAANIEGLKPPFVFDLITGGRSNLTYKVIDAAGRAIVVRRPPTGKILATAHDMTREHRIVSAVGRSEVPVPATLGLCEDPEVNELPFYVMDYVEGHVLVDSTDSRTNIPENVRAGLSEHVAEVLANLHSLDPASVDLASLSKHEDYIPRQLRRWYSMWEKTKTRELPAMEQVHRALAERIPEQLGYAIVHGDYRVGNMLVSGEGRVQAVLDWELCTLGDPLADIGYLLNNWAEPGEKIGDGGAALSPTAVGGFWSRDELVAHYSKLTGRSLDQVNYYRAFQYWRLASIVEGVLARYMKGAMADKINLDVFRDQIDELAKAAVEMVDTL
jgi:aminoglycoside phosphotransferase (APT) family kinase protein